MKVTKISVVTGALGFVKNGTEKYNEKRSWVTLKLKNYRKSLCLVHLISPERHYPSKLIDFYLVLTLGPGYYVVLWHEVEETLVVIIIIIITLY